MMEERFRQYTAHTWNLIAATSLSDCAHGDCVGLSLMDYDRPSFDVRFVPAQLKQLRELVFELECLRRKKETDFDS